MTLQQRQVIPKHGGKLQKKLQFPESWISGQQGWESGRLFLLEFYLKVFSYVWLFWVFGSAWDFLQLQTVAATVLCRASLTAEHRLQGVQSSVATARGLSNCSFLALEHSPGSSGTQAELLFGIWILPRPGTEPASSALAGRFFTTESLGKPYNSY